MGVNLDDRKIDFVMVGKGPLRATSKEHKGDGAQKRAGIKRRPRAPSATRNAKGQGGWQIRQGGVPNQQQTTEQKARDKAKSINEVLELIYGIHAVSRAAGHPEKRFIEVWALKGRDDERLHPLLAGWVPRYRGAGVMNRKTLDDKAAITGTSWPR